MNEQPANLDSGPDTSYQQGKFLGPPEPRFLHLPMGLLVLFTNGGMVDRTGGTSYCTRILERDRLQGPGPGPLWATHRQTLRHLVGAAQGSLDHRAWRVW